MLGLLRDRPMRVTEIAGSFDMSLSGVSKHIRVLERAGLVERRVTGRDHWVSLNGQPLIQVFEWIETYRVFWEDRLDALESFLLHQKEQRGGRKSQ